MKILVKVKGGLGSGNWGHSGIPGKRGGSVPRSSHMPIKSSDWMERQESRSGEWNERERDEREEYREAEVERDYQANLSALKDLGIHNFDAIADITDQVNEKYSLDDCIGYAELSLRDNYKPDMGNSPGLTASSMVLRLTGTEYTYHITNSETREDYQRENLKVAGYLRENTSLPKQTRMQLAKMSEDSYPDDFIQQRMEEFGQVESYRISDAWRPGFYQRFNALPKPDQERLAVDLGTYLHGNEVASKILLAPTELNLRRYSATKDTTFSKTSMDSVDRMAKRGIFSIAYEWAKRNSGPTWDGRRLPDFKKQFAKAVVILAKGDSLWEESEPKGSDKRVKFSMPEF